MFKKIKKLIEDNDNIIIISHIFPDGDAYGSQIGLKEAIKNTYPNKNVYVSGSGIKDFYNLIGEPDEVDDSLFEDALVFLLDSNDLDRFEDQRFRNAKKTILIDHHLKYGRVLDADIVLSNEEAVATTQIVFHLCNEIGLKINSVGANALFLGLLTDSGRFQFVNDFEETFIDAAELVKLGAKPKEIYKILNVVKEKDLIVRSIIFSRLKRYKEGMLVSYLKYKDIKKLNISSTQAANYVNLLANIENYPIWVVASEDINGNVKFEFRSNKYVIQPIAAKYGGGGHAFACGLTVNNCSKEQYKAIIEDLLAILRGN